MPSRLRYRDSGGVFPPVIGLAKDGWTITSRKRFADNRAAGRVSRGDHGYDPKYASMHGLFVAAGPRVRQGIVVPAFTSVHIYDFLCALLGLAPAPNDGEPDATRRFLEN